MKGPGDKENSSGDQVGISQPGKASLVNTLKHTVARKGNPSVLAPGEYVSRMIESFMFTNSSSIQDCITSVIKMTNYFDSKF